MTSYTHYSRSDVTATYHHAEVRNSRHRRGMCVIRWTSRKDSFESDDFWTADAAIKFLDRVDMKTVVRPKGR